MRELRPHCVSQKKVNFSFEALLQLCFSIRWERHCLPMFSSWSMVSRGKTSSRKVLLQLFWNEFIHSFRAAAATPNSTAPRMIVFALFLAHLPLSLLSFISAWVNCFIAIHSLIVLSDSGTDDGNLNAVCPHRSPPSRNPSYFHFFSSSHSLERVHRDHSQRVRSCLTR